MFIYMCVPKLCLLKFSSRKNDGDNVYSLCQFMFPQVASCHSVSKSFITRSGSSSWPIFFLIKHRLCHTNKELLVLFWNVVSENTSFLSLTPSGKFSPLGIEGESKSGWGRMTQRWRESLRMYQRWKDGWVKKNSWKHKKFDKRRTLHSKWLNEWNEKLLLFH